MVNDRVPYGPHYVFKENCVEKLKRTYVKPKDRETSNEFLKYSVEFSWSKDIINNQNGNLISNFNSN